MRYLDTPARVLECFVAQQRGEGAWPFNDGSDDPFWQFGPTPRDYRWTLTLQVRAQHHSSYRTRQPQQYNGMDVRVGDYVASTRDGTALRIVSITSKREEEIECLVEDVFRYNQHKDQSGYGNGLFDVPSEAMIFSVNEQGLPVVDPLPPSGVGPGFYANLMSRFQNLERLSNFIVHQPGHGFEVGQLISADQEQHSFALTDDDHPYVIGTVVYLNGPDDFTVNPIQKVVDNLDDLDGEIGDILYADSLSAGDLTLRAGTNPVMIKLRNANPSTCRSTVANATSTGVMSINNVAVAPTASSVSALVSAINGKTAQHGLTASLVPLTTHCSTVVGSISPQYGEVLALNTGAVLAARINGVVVQFQQGRYGGHRYGSEDFLAAEDIANQINLAGIPGLWADVDGGYLGLRNTLGGGITIANIHPDANQTAFAGPNSITGLPLLTVTQPGNLIEITAPDARSIDLTNLIGDPIGDHGFYSVENGTKAAAIFIEQGIRTASNYVVPDLAGRDALEAIVGDQAYVIDKSDQQWGLYLYTGSSWSQISTAESAKVDSDTCRVVVTRQTTSEVIARINGGSKVTSITVEVTEAFDALPELRIGTSGVHDLLLGPDDTDLKTVGTYVVQPTHVFPVGADIAVTAFLSGMGATTGSAEITVTYQ